MTKPISPYIRLLNEIQVYCDSIRHLRVIDMFMYPAQKLKESTWNLYGLSERVKAAEQLGYDVILKTTDEGLLVSYRKQLPNPPCKWI